MQRIKVELLAPAGNMEAFLGAIHAGADAVYLAGNKYGARAYADNFSEEEILFCIRYAHLWGRKVYLTINTLFKEKELKDLYEYIEGYYAAGLDACIIQDIGVMSYIKECFPDMEIHISTQMSITTKYGASFLKEAGATRIVPARELSLSEIKDIKMNSGIEIETFIHGAMCYSYSGQCLFSSILGGRSGNRGRCAQPCRLPYRVQSGNHVSDEGYPLSLKDMCTLEMVDELIDAGIDSFKIEGRMKKAEYAAGVTAIYRKYIDRKMKQPDKNLIIDKKDLEQLAFLYLRSEQQTGYYHKQNGKDMITLKNPSYNGSDDALLNEIRDKYIVCKPRMPISVFANIICGEKSSITMIYKGNCVTVYGSLVEEAQNQPISRENIKKQLSKLGETSFEISSLEINMDNCAFFSLKELNQLRREAVRKLENMIIENNGFISERNKSSNMFSNISVLNKNDKMHETKYSSDWSVLISTKNQWEIFIEYLKNSSLKFERVYLESRIISEIDKTDLVNEKNLYIALPYICRSKDISFLSDYVAYAKKHEYNGFLVRNLEEYAYLKSINYTGEIIVDSNLYIWNSMALKFWKERVDEVNLPYELNYHEEHELFHGIAYEKMYYGRIPMMISANCVNKTCFNCGNNANKDNDIWIIDRYKKHFPVAVLCKYCMNIVYNSVPLSLHKEIMKKGSSCVKKLAFTTENAQETERILRFYDEINQGKTPEFPLKEYTTAHEKRGVQ